MSLKQTWAQNIPNLFRPEERVESRSPKLLVWAEWMKTFLEVPVDAYVSPRGFKETDHAKKTKVEWKNLVVV